MIGGFSFFTEFNPAVDEWAGESGDIQLGLYGPSGWCLVGVFVIQPRYFAVIFLNRAVGIFK